MNGRISRDSAARRAVSPESTAAAHFSRNAVCPPSSPGTVAAVRLHSSSDRFSTGVPDSATRNAASSANAALARCELAFLMAWASSRINVPNGTALSRSTSRTSTP
jgi:hypothetical protein